MVVCINNRHINNCTQSYLISRIMPNHILLYLSRLR